jgi:hypothetical protein
MSLEVSTQILSISIALCAVWMAYLYRNRVRKLIEVFGTPRESRSESSYGMAAGVGTNTDRVRLESDLQGEGDGLIACVKVLERDLTDIERELQKLSSVRPRQAGVIKTEIIKILSEKSNQLSQTNASIIDEEKVGVAH